MDQGGDPMGAGAGGAPAGPPPGGPQRRAPPAVGAGAGAGSNALHVADEVADKLMILDYEQGFCARKDITPFARTYFALPADNAGLQFAQFMELVKWLMSRCEHEFTTDKYDDPNTSVNKMMLELKQMGFEMDFPTQKLKQAHGEAVTRVLSFLCDQALALQGFQWDKPVYPEEDFAEEAEVDDEAEVVGEVEDEAAAEDEEEVMYEELARGSGSGDGGKEEDESKGREALEATVDPIAWRTELERVAPRLKISGLGTAGKEWRAHLEQTMTHEKTIHEVLPDTTSALSKIASEVGSMLERLVAKEKYINTHFEHLAEEYSGEQDKLRGATDVYQTTSQKVTSLTQELQSVQDAFEEVKGSMDDRGHSMTDTSPLVKIKSALTKLKNEIKTMDLRIGVVGHTLMQAKVRHKTGGGAGGDADGDASRDGDEPDFDLEDDDFD